MKDKGADIMTDKGRRFIYIFLAVMIALSSAVSMVYADQPYRGTVKHKRSLRNANVNNAPDEYKDIDGATKDSDKNTVSISFTSDMEQDMELYARAATYFKAESGHYPRSFMLDAGNYSQATPYNSVFAQYYPGINAMGAAGYDIVGIGSSEVSQGGKKLVNMLNNAAKSDNTLPYITSANIAGTNDLENAYKKYGVNDYLDMNKYRTEVAVFSIVGEDAFNAQGTDQLRCEDSAKTAKKIVNEIKKDEDADMIICMCASGLGEEDDGKALEQRIAKAAPDIDIIISCGSTTALDKPMKVGKTRIFSLAAGESRVGRIEYVIENNSYRYSGYSTVILDDSYKKDGEVMKRLNNAAKAANKNYFAANGYSSGQVLCDSFFEIEPLLDNAGRPGDAPLGELIADSYRFAATEDAKLPKGNLIAVCSDESCIGGIAEGKVRVNDVYDIMCMRKSDNGTKGHALTSFYLYGSDLRVLAEMAATSYMDENGGRLYFSGLNYKYNPHRLKDSRIYDITVIEDATGSQIDLKDKTLYRVVTDKTTAFRIPEMRGAGNRELHVTIKDENGKAITKLNELARSADKDKPLKTWVAMAEYLSSFNEAGIPATYKSPDGRMVYDDSKSFSHVFKGETITLVSSAVVALIGIAALIVLVLLVLNLLNIKVDLKSSKKKR